MVSLTRADNGYDGKLKTLIMFGIFRANSR